MISNLSISLPSTGLYVTVGLILLMVWTFTRSRKFRKLPPGPTPIFPLLGNIPQLLRYGSSSGYEVLENMKRKYGQVVYWEYGNARDVVVEDLETVKHLLSSDAWSSRLSDPYIEERSYGKELGIIFTSYSKCKDIRAFSAKALRDFGFGKKFGTTSALNLEISCLLPLLDSYASSGKPLKMHGFFTVSVINVLWGMVAGETFEHDDPKLRRLIESVEETSKNNGPEPWIFRAFPFLWKIARHHSRMKRRWACVTALQHFIQETIDEKLKMLEMNPIPTNFIEAFICKIQSLRGSDPPDHPYTHEQLVTTVHDLFVAGSETTSNLLEFAILFMVLYPDIQRKVQKEIDEITETGKLILDSKTVMPYTEATLLETMRHANVIPMEVRQADRDTIVNGYHIPKGTVLYVLFYKLHKSHLIWDDPDAFRPERFLTENGKNLVNTNKILPFGLGRRSCFGETLARNTVFYLFTSLLQKFTFSSVVGEKIPSTEPQMGFTCSPQPYEVMVTRR